MPTRRTRWSFPDALAERLAGFKAVLDDRSLATALIAIQGPRSVDVLAPHTDVDLGALRYYGIAEGHVAGMEALVARTGYTGEDGFEVFVDWDRATELWDVLMPAVEAAGGLPVGLGARDTLRLEAGMPLYGNELDTSTNPFEAGLGRVVKLTKPGDFVGRAAFERAASAAPTRTLVGLVVEGRGIARHGYPVYAGERRTGVVTSGTHSPTIGSPIAMAYVAPADAEPGTIVEVEIRDQRVPARVVPLPFYKRQEVPADPSAWGTRDYGGASSMVPTDLRYTKDHEWVRVEGDEATIGITEYAADQLGDIVFVELPAAGSSLDQFATFGVVESVKAVSDLFAPVGGDVTGANDELTGNPELVNSDPYGAGWMLRVRVADPAQLDELLAPDAYDALIAEG